MIKRDATRPISPEIRKQGDASRPVCLESDRVVGGPGSFLGVIPCPPAQFSLQTRFLMFQEVDDGLS